MEYIEINETTNLNGSVRIQGSKNSSLSLMAAACLSDEPVVLENVPEISDVYTFMDIMNDMGASVYFNEKNQLVINASGISDPKISSQKTRIVRPSYYFIGALLNRHKKLRLGYPGGDMIGKRPIDQHIKGLIQMGAEVEFFEDAYHVSARKLKGCEIYFDVVTGGATLNMLMLAATSEGTTIIHNAARDPEVVDTAVMLNKMGAIIHGAGTPTLRIEGVKSLHGCRHQVIPDRLIAGTYLIAVGIAGGTVTVDDVIYEHLAPLIFKLKEAGMGFEIKDTSIKAVSDDKIKPLRITAEKFPVFETDFQQPVSALLINASGNSIIEDRVYPERSAHCRELVKLGADIMWDNGCAYITGGRKLKGCVVNACDIRAGACLVLAGLRAEGRTVVTGASHIERGFRDIVGDFRCLGADIKRLPGELVASSAVV